MSSTDVALENEWNWGYNAAVDHVKNILKKQSFIHFNINEQYSIQPLITQAQINKFLKDLLDWIFQESEGTKS